MKKVCSTLLALVLVISMLAVGCNGDGSDVRLPRRPIPNVLVVTQADTLTVDQKGSARFESQINVPRSPLADLYYEAYRYSEQWTEYDEEGNVVATGSGWKSGEEAFLQDFAQQLQEIYFASTGIELVDSQVSVDRVRFESHGDFLINTNAGTLPIAEPTLEALHIWGLDIGYLCDGDMELNIVMTQLLFQKLLLQSLEKYDGIVWTSTMAIRLPVGATITNYKEFDRLQWTLNFGGETRRHLEVQVADYGEFQEVVLTETTEVCRAPLAPGPGFGLAYLGNFADPNAPPPYRTFAIEYEMRGSTSLSSPLADSSPDPGTAEYQLPWSTEVTSATPHSSTGPPATRKSVADWSKDDWRWSWGATRSYGPNLPFTWELPEGGDVEKLDGFDELKTHVKLGMKPGVSLTPFIGITWGWYCKAWPPHCWFSLKDFGIGLDVDPEILFQLQLDLLAKYKNQWDIFDWMPYERDIHIIVWGVPVTFHFTINCKVAAELEAEAKISYEVDYTVSAYASLGYRWTRGEGHRRLWDSGWGQEYTHRPLDSIEAGAKAVVEPYVTVRMSFALYSLVGIYLDVVPKARVTGELHWDQPDDFKASCVLEACLEVAWGFCFGLEELLENYNIALADFLRAMGEPKTLWGPRCWVLWSAELEVDTRDLTIQTGQGGTTDPGPAVHTRPKGMTLEIEALPEKPGWLFDSWTGQVDKVGDVSAPSTTIVMDDDYIITANFRINKDLYGGGEGTLDDPFQIRDWHHLHNIRYHPNLHFVLMNDLDDRTAGYDARVGKSKGIRGWQPIGSRMRPFTGTFHGQDYTISRLIINREFSGPVGLFGVVGRIEGGVLGKIEHVQLGEVSVGGDYSVGGLVGLLMPTGNVVASHVLNGQVSGDHAQVGGLVGGNYGQVMHSSAGASVEGGDMAGGLVGSNHGVVSRSAAKGVVRSDGEAVGGLVGYNTGTILSSQAAGDVYDGRLTGGLVGHNEGVINRSCATGSVYNGRYSGGLVGLNLCGGRVLDSYARGDVAGTNYIGGLVGANYEAVIDKSYATGRVTVEPGRPKIEKAIAGGLVGWNRLGTVWDSFWDGQTSGMKESDGGTWKSTEEMKDIATFTETATVGLDRPWNMVRVKHSDERDPKCIWNIAERDYPLLSCQPIS